MTCQELHCYLENPLRIDVYMYRETLPAPVSEHIEKCRDCASLFEEQRALGISLNLTRDAAPQVPASLDATVLANYRRQLAEPQGLSASKRLAWGFSNVWLRRGVATAAVAAIALVLFFVSRNGSPTNSKNAVSSQTHVPTAVDEQRPDSSARQASAFQTARTEPHVARANAVSTVASRNPLPPGFSSLMYCDEMSCSGAMEVIRVELPSAAGSNPAYSVGAPTMAEVLVGADGVARGIRIVQ